MNPAAKRQRTDDADGVGTNPHASAQHQQVPYGSSGIPGQTYQTYVPRYSDAPIAGGPYTVANTYYHPPHQYAPIYMPPPRPSQMYYPNPIPDGITVPRIEELDTSGLVQSTLVNHYVQQAFEEQSEIIDFDHLSKRAWHAINSQYAGMSGSKQYDRSWDVTRDVVECIESIRGQVKEFSSFDTKVNALETLRKIAKTILLSGDVIGHEVRQHFQCESAFSEAVAEILDSMSEDECVAAGQNVSEVGKGTLLEKLEWVCAEAEDHCLEDLDVSEACARLRYDDPDEVTDEEYEKEDEGGGDDQDEEEDEDENQEDYEREMKDPPEETMDEATHQTRTRNRLTPLNSQLALIKSNIY
ncbi:hypothetical protein CB0940_06612 [Cercospora beticola]|uniref:Uncharacterized protein n=1 Tax=Cercospora beticola TaxID=122368 RepID=A0A2G5HYK9_CERBT|nr:hypothetical protein CB0940_06612 [Cercospora beticola]PIA97619.1 hypothetical protein CB0940_06612 [Cercospora beticola]